MNDVEIIYDESGLTALWACQNLGDYSPLSGDFFTFAFRRKGKIIGALVFSGYRPDHDVWWTIYTTDRHWCTPKVLKTAFTAAFEYLISMLVPLHLLVDGLVDEAIHALAVGFCVGLDGVFLTFLDR